jgi:hypothetical protein
LSHYKPFPQSELIRDWGKLIKLSREEIVKLHESWKEIDKENKEINKKLLEEKSSKIKEVVEFLKTAGIDVNKYKSGKLFREKNGYQSWFDKNVVDIISAKYPYYRNTIPTAHPSSMEVDGVTLSNNQSPTNIVELYDKIINQYKYKIKEVNKTDKLLIKSIEYASKNNLDIEDMSPKDIIYTVAEAAKENYLADNVPVGSEVYLKHECYECNTYIMGEHRCSCGNRRISIVVEGSLIDGFYHYPEAY